MQVSPENLLGTARLSEYIPCFTIFHHFLCILVLLSGDRFSNFALSSIKNPGCVAEFWAMRPCFHVMHSVTFIFF